jgi:hypothetical protein
VSAAPTGGPLLRKALDGTIVWPPLQGKPASKWLWSPLVDTMLIAGVGSFALAAIFVPVALAWPAANTLILAGFLHAGVLCNYPHYAATYHLIYRERETKKKNWRWLLASIPIALAAFVAGIAYPLLLGPLVRLYLTWSAWHYAAQHFGIASMYAAREGRPLQDREKRLLQAGFGGVGVSMMIVANSANGVGSDNPFGAALYGNAIALLPERTYWLSLVVAAAATLCAYAAHRRVRARTGRGLDVTAWLLFGTNLAWFVLPYLRLPGGHGPWMGPLAIWVAFLVPFFHCAQYLGVTAWRARTTGPVKPVFLFMALVALGLALFEGWTALVPRFSRLKYDEALMLVPPLLNVHHFFIDGIIWKRPKKPPAAGAARVAVDLPRAA